MGERSNISWTRSTFNPWIGCTKVGPGCDHCYAEVQDSRKRWGGVAHWGHGVRRHRTSASNWKGPATWNKQAPDSEFAGRRGFWPVFCASLADVFDNEVPTEWRLDLWNLIRDTPHLQWLLVTKRISNAAAMVPNGWGWLPNIRIMITVVNQEEADRDVPKLLALPCKNGISYEPALGPVDWRLWMPGKWEAEWKAPRPLEWIIVGGESNQGANKARPFDPDWARNTIAQCKVAGVPVFVKQLGSYPIWEPTEFHEGIEAKSLKLKDRAGADSAEWPEDLRVQEFPA